MENGVIHGFPPRAFYVHGNTNAVSVYFNTELHLAMPGGDVTIPRGTLFGQLTLAGHGMSYSSFEIPSFETEMETELQTPMPLNPNPFRNVVIEDFSPNYSAVPPAQIARSYLSNGVFVLHVTNLMAQTTNLIQIANSLPPTNWVTIGTSVTTTGAFSFQDPELGTNRQRYYRVRQLP